MKKILFLTNMFPSKKNRSFGTFVKETYDWLSESYKTRLICITYERNKIKKALKYIRFNIAGIIAGIFGKYDLLYAHYISHSAYVVKIIRFFNKKIKIVGNVHGDDALSTERRFSKNIKRSRVFVNRADYMIVPSVSAKNRFLSIYEMNPFNVFVSPSGGIDGKLFYPEKKETVKKMLGFKNEHVIGFVSRIVEDKGWDTFIKVAAFMKKNIKDESFKFLMIGSGDCKDKASKLIKEYNLEDVFVVLPAVPHDELRIYYSSMDVFCLLSRIKTETLGLVGLEAMACGTMCVVSKVDGFLTYAVDGYNSYCVDATDVEGISKKIIDFQNLNNEKKDVFLENAIVTAKKYNIESVKTDFLAFFDSILYEGG